MTRGTTENISIATTPAGARAEISGLEIPTACVTPCVVQAKRNADITVTINKDGYEPQIIPLTKEIPGSGAAGFASNILAGGLIWYGRGRCDRSSAGSQAESGDCYSAAPCASTLAPSKAASAKTVAARELSSRIFLAFVT
jgi:hypothetical protein